MRILLGLGFAAGLLQSAVGLLATLEPGVDPLPWRLLYGGAALGCGVGLAWLVRTRGRKDA